MINIWKKDWQFWFAVGTLLVSSVVGVWYGTQGTVRYGSTQLVPLSLNDVCSYDPRIPNQVLFQIDPNLTDSQRNQITQSLCTVLDGYVYDDISIGCWFICPDSTSALDSLWVLIRNNSTEILGMIAVSSIVDSIQHSISKDKKSLKFIVPSLVGGEQFSLILLLRGQSDSPFSVSFPRGTGETLLLEIAESYPWSYRFLRYSLFFLAGIALAISVLLFRRHMKRRVSIDFVNLKDFQDTVKELSDVFNSRREPGDNA